jgi:cytoskeletal protein CcmA (bactofilin family)
MFGNNKKKEHIQDDKSTSIISTSTIVKGDINSQGSIRLDGNMVGNLYAKSRIVLGTTATVTGNIASYDMEVAGNVNGTLKVDDVLILKSTCVVHGDVFTSKLIVEEGAQFDGKCSMGSYEKLVEKTDNKIDTENFLKE